MCLLNLIKTGGGGGGGGVTFPKFNIELDEKYKFSEFQGMAT